MSEGYIWRNGRGWGIHEWLWCLLGPDPGHKCLGNWLTFWWSCKSLKDRRKINQLIHLVVFILTSVWHQEVMARSQKDVINFAALERELATAVESERRYKRENSAKLRAVDQNVASYEQFRWFQASKQQQMSHQTFCQSQRPEKVLDHVCRGLWRFSSFFQTSNMYVSLSEVWSWHLTWSPWTRTTKMVAHGNNCGTLLPLATSDLLVPSNQ